MLDHYDQGKYRAHRERKQPMLNSFRNTHIVDPKHYLFQQFTAHGDAIIEWCQ